jgi:hypothetical protein
MPVQTATTIRQQIIALLDTIPEIATVHDGAIRVGVNLPTPLVFVLGTRHGEEPSTFSSDVVVYTFDVFVYVESVLGREGEVETTLATIVEGIFATLPTIENALITIGPSQLVAGANGSVLQVVGDTYYRAERVPVRIEQDREL